MTQNFIWIAGNYSQSGADLTSTEIEKLTSILLNLMPMFNQDAEDEENLVEVIKSLALLAQIEGEGSRKVVAAFDHPGQGNGALVSYMCQFLGRKNEEIYAGAVRYLGSVLLSSDPRVAEKIILHNSLDKLADIMLSTHGKHLKESLWLLSNLASSGSECSRAVISSPVFGRVLALCGSSACDVKTEALWALATCIQSYSGAEAQELLILKNEECTVVLFKALTIKDPRLVTQLLLALKGLFAIDATFVYHKLYEYNGLDVIQALANHDQEIVFDAAQELFEIYLESEAEFGDQVYMVEENPNKYKNETN